MKKIMLFIGLKLFEFLTVGVPLTVFLGLIVLICYLGEKLLSAKIIILSICGIAVLLGIIAGVTTWVKFNLRLMKQPHPFKKAWKRIWEK